MGQALLPSFCSLLCPPLPRRLAAMGMHAEPLGYGLRFLVNVVARSMSRIEKRGVWVADVEDDNL
jgi:hypothetical protein